MKILIVLLLIANITHAGNNTIPAPFDKKVVKSYTDGLITFNNGDEVKITSEAKLKIISKKVCQELSDIIYFARDTKIFLEKVSTHISKLENIQFDYFRIKCRPYHKYKTFRNLVPKGSIILTLLSRFRRHDKSFYMYAELIASFIRDNNLPFNIPKGIVSKNTILDDIADNFFFDKNKKYIQENQATDKKLLEIQNITEGIRADFNEEYDELILKNPVRKSFLKYDKNYYALRSCEIKKECICEEFAGIYCKDIAK